ncbi:hypothetical protein JMJ77_0009980, partial [Colletotrichum scovillei]
YPYLTYTVAGVSNSKPGAAPPIPLPLHLAAQSSIPRTSLGDMPDRDPCRSAARYSVTIESFSSPSFDEDQKSTESLYYSLGLPSSEGGSAGRDGPTRLVARKPSENEKEKKTICDPSELVDRILAFSFLFPVLSLQQGNPLGRMALCPCPGRYPYFADSNQLIPPVSSMTTRRSLVSKTQPGGCLATAERKRMRQTARGETNGSQSCQQLSARALGKGGREEQEVTTDCFSKS